MTTLETVEQQFAKMVENHVLTVLTDNGNVSRHIRCRQPGTVHYGWDIVTWPGYLAITGDLGHYVFRRLDDMLVQFFSGPINPPYWLEKCVAWDSPLRVVSVDHVRHMASNKMSDLDDMDSLTQKIKDAWEYAIEVAGRCDGRASFDEVYDALEDTGTDMCDVYDGMAGYCSHAVRALCAIKWTQEQYLALKGVL